ncbi:MAG: hypothetical protein E6R03_03515 [Hyphomicrobiaceae bacterium]|nr:MAG: hypothetical protein E6R03_03515 [Hyphomicrobiaceae bacterium]
MNQGLVTNDQGLSTHLKRLALLKREAVIGLLTAASQSSQAWSDKCARASGWAARNWSVTDPTIPPDILRLLSSFPFWTYFDHQLVTNPPQVPAVPQGETAYQRRLKTQAVVLACLKNTTSGSLGIEPRRVGYANTDQPPPPAKPAKPEKVIQPLLRLDGPTLGERTKFICKVCHQPRDGPQCTDKDGVGPQCCECHFREVDSRPVESRDERPESRARKKRKC